MNRELLAKVRDRIVAYPENFDMIEFVQGREMVGEGEPACGTTACIAGHALAIARGRYSLMELSLPGADAAKLLDLPLNSYRLDGEPWLFYQECWPIKYWQLAKDEGDAKGAVALIDDILAGVIAIEDHPGPISAPLLVTDQR